MNAPAFHKIANRANRQLSTLCGIMRPEIDVWGIFEVIRKSAEFYGETLTPICEDGTQWEGLLCGEEGHCYIKFAEYTRSSLYLYWYKRPSGNYEVNSYITQ